MQNPIESATKIIEWWSTKGYNTTDYNVVIDARGKLAGLYFYINEEWANANKEAETAKFCRKSKISDIYIDTIEKRDGNGKRKFTVEQVKHISERGAQEEIREELIASIYAKKMSLLSESVKEVLNSMSQKVATARDEMKKSS